MSSVLKQIGAWLSMIMLAKQTMVNGDNSPRRLLVGDNDGDVIIFVKYDLELLEPVVPVEVSRSGSFGDIVREYARLTRNPSFNRLHAFVSGEQKQNGALLADSSVSPESVVELKREEEVDLVFEHQEQVGGVWTTHSITVRVNEDITQSLEHQLSSSPEWWSVQDGAATDTHRGCDHCHIIIGLDSVEMQLTRLPSECPMVQIPDPHARSYYSPSQSITDLLSATNPEGIIEERPDSVVAIFTDYASDGYWIARIPE